MADLLHRRARLAAGAAAGFLLLLPLAACSSSNVDCSGTSCTATLTGDDAKASILGNELAFAGTQDGKATLQLGDQSVSCAEGDSVSAGPLSITCTSVTDDGVEFTAEVG
ncbi:hypothetical protein [Modestobacter versicolor]|uniref:Secreted protein n=1 Tax=Modestobacter versicolor TaxID=429133 RepID=A0A323V961_9ACTN|nr:hypothetical protein [Modestobacter versicolor]MBB3677862.1 hypothetical protein [Modestobacter versicolor]PZA21304.1 hypothetical protein DMO24_10935 [Modestobacter versicolor]